MKIVIAQINSHLGQFSKNTEKILKYVTSAQREGCSMVVFPECALSGYHPMDFLEMEGFVDRQWKEVERLHCKIPEGIGVLVGAFSFNSKKKGKNFFNSAVFLEKGKRVKIFSKELLPTYDVFDEGRHIESGDISNNLLTFKKRRFLITICEDIWAWPDKDKKSFYKYNPLHKIDKNSVDCVLNLSASPFYLGKEEKRLEMAKETSRYFKAPLVYSNLIGGQDELIFDGSSFVLDNQGEIFIQGKSFEEDSLIFNLSSSQNELPLKSNYSDLEKLRRALVLGIGDYVCKSGFQKAHLGLSGGIDSALVLCLLVEALGSENVTAVGLPSSYNDPRSLEVAKELADNLEVSWLELPIQGTWDVMVKALEERADLGEFGLVHENLQARIRGNFLMALSNQLSSLLISTGNKSEYATGYSTLYGDMCGALAPIGDLLKNQVYGLAEYYNREKEVIPRFIIDRPPSAELRHNQKDQDTLPDYDDLDKAVDKLVTHCGKQRGKLEQWAKKSIVRSEFKRWQAPPILKVSKHGFGVGRRMPLAFYIDL